LRKIPPKVIEGILDIPPEYLPSRDCFLSGVKAFKQEFHPAFQPAFDLKAWMSLGAEFWKEKLEEQAAEEAAKREMAETEIVENEALVSVAKRGVSAELSGESEEEEILELKMQEPVVRELEDNWTPERIVRILKSIIRMGAFQVRRSRWFTRLCESMLIWSPARGDAEMRNLIVFKEGIPISKAPLSSSEIKPVHKGHEKTIVERQRNFDIFVFERMRITTTEIRRLIQEGRTVELHLHPDVCLRNEQLKKMLRWL